MRSGERVCFVWVCVSVFHFHRGGPVVFFRDVFSVLSEHTPRPLIFLVLCLSVFRVFEYPPVLFLRRILRRPRRRWGRG